MRIGIDIGTHSARAAMIGPDGRPQLIRLRSGRTTLAAFARQTMHGLVVGDEAAQAIVGNGETTIAGCTRLLGRAGRLPAEMLAQLPYAVRDVAGELWCNLVYDEVRVSAVYGQIVAALIAEAQQALATPIESVVVCVPASAEDRFRVQARAAIEATGVRVHRLINQPAAALLALGAAARAPAPGSHVAVVACGGATTEVSIARCEPGGIRTIATCGDTMLGGDDIVWAIAQQLNRRLQRTSGVDVLASGDSRASAYGLRAAVEEQLAHLRRAPEALITIDHGAGFGRDIATPLRRADVDSWAAPLFGRIAELCRRATGTAGITAQGIERVIVIGEWAWLPGLAEALAESFGRLAAQIETDAAPALAACGAALAGSADAPTLWDVTPYPLGINCYYGDQELFSPIIAANTPIPTATASMPGAHTQSYQTRFPDQTSVSLSVLQYRGERDCNPYGPQPVQPQECETLGTWHWSGLKPRRGRCAAFTVTFEVDADGILSLYASETGTRTTLRAQVERGIG
jgi:molecular chaperone HscA